MERPISAKATHCTTTCQDPIKRQPLQGFQLSSLSCPTKHGLTRCDPRRHPSFQIPSFASALNLTAQFLRTDCKLCRRFQASLTTWTPPTTNQFSVKIPNLHPPPSLPARFANTKTCERACKTCPQSRIACPSWRMVAFVARSPDLSLLPSSSCFGSAQKFPPSPQR